MVKYLPGFTVMVAPAAICCTLFKIHCPPDCGLIMICEPLGNGVGGCSGKAAESEVEGAGHLVENVENEKRGWQERNRQRIFLK